LYFCSVAGRGGGGHRKEASKPNTGFKPRHPIPATALPLPPPPGREKSLSAKNVDVKHSTEVNRTSPVDSKVSALRAYRRAKGLCQYYAEMYFRGHKCASTVQLQAVQELWDMLQPEVESAEMIDASDQEAELNYLLSQEAVVVGGTTKSLKFLGSFQGNEVVMLVDSAVPILLLT
jgi:hypothetical protein